MTWTFHGMRIRPQHNLGGNRASVYHLENNMSVVVGGDCTNDDTRGVTGIHRFAVCLVVVVVGIGIDHLLRRAPECKQLQVRRS